MGQVSEGEQLLDTVRDYFYFATKFFEPISASAAHIYHSALELSPKSSIVRKLYYDRNNRIASLPRVLFGIPDSWDPTISISTDPQYKSSTWSPCGRFIAARTGKVVEIWNQLTFEPLTTLRPTEGSFSTPPLAFSPRGLIAYSPDGRSLACSFSTTIIVWDIQTGGVLKEIECGFTNPSPVWSQDGRVIGVLGKTLDVHTYEAASGTTQTLAKLHSRDKKPLFYLMWAHEDSFRAVTIIHREHEPGFTVDLFEVGSTLSKFHSFAFTRFLPSTRLHMVLLSNNLPRFLFQYYYVNGRYHNGSGELLAANSERLLNLFFS